jgi:hypothetical protein
MPTEHTHNPTVSTYDSQAEKYLTTKNMATITAMISGMTDVDRVEKWIQVEASGQARQDVIGMLNRKKQELKE